LRHIDGDILRTYLANVTFTGESTGWKWSEICVTGLRTVTDCSDCSAWCLTGWL
jgi:hypothetical protein